MAGTAAPGAISSLARISLPVFAILSVTVSKGGSAGPYTTTRWAGSETTNALAAGGGVSASEGEVSE